MSHQAPAPDHEGLPPGYPFRDDCEITPRQVRRLLVAGEPPLLLDCRTPEEHEAAAIVAAVLMPMHEIPSRLEELLPHRDRRVVVLCHHGVRSLQVAAFLRRQGFADVRSMAGGIDLWALDIDPSVPRY